MRREPGQYASCSPEAVSRGSQAQVQFFVEDAKHDIAELLAEVARLREAAKGQIVVVNRAVSECNLAKLTCGILKDRCDQEMRQAAKLQSELSGMGRTLWMILRANDGFTLGHNDLRSYPGDDRVEITSMYDARTDATAFKAHLKTRG